MSRIYYIGEYLDGSTPYEQEDVFEEDIDFLDNPILFNVYNTLAQEYERYWNELGVYLIKEWDASEFPLVTLTLDKNISKTEMFMVAEFTRFKLKESLSLVDYQGWLLLEAVEDEDIEKDIEDYFYE